MIIIDCEQGTEEWFEARMGVPSASNFSRICTTTGKWSAQADSYINELAAEVIRLQAVYDAKAYQRTRSLEYPSVQDQLDMQYWDSVNGTTTWATAIAKVKTDNPKP